MGPGSAGRWARPPAGRPILQDIGSLCKTRFTSWTAAAGATDGRGPSHENGPWDGRTRHTGLASAPASGMSR